MTPETAWIVIAAVLLVGVIIVCTTVWKVAPSLQVARQSAIPRLMSDTDEARVDIDPKGTILDVSSTVLLMTGYTREEVVGQNVKTLMPEPYRTEHDGYLKHHAETGEEHIIGRGRDVRVRHKDGDEFPARLGVSKIVGPDGKPVKYIGTLRETTRQEWAKLIAGVKP